MYIFPFLRNGCISDYHQEMFLHQIWAGHMGTQDNSVWVCKVQVYEDLRCKCMMPYGFGWTKYVVVYYKSKVRDKESI
jgi:hypothetical protein